MNEEAIMLQLPKTLSPDAVVMVVAHKDNTHNLPEIERHVDKLNESGRWIAFETRVVVSDTNVRPGTVLILTTYGIISGTKANLKNRARALGITCVSADLTKNQLIRVLNHLSALRKPVPASTPAARSDIGQNGSKASHNGSANGHHSLTVDTPVVDLGAQSAAGSRLADSETASAEPNPPDVVLPPEETAYDKLTNLMKAASAAQEALVELSETREKLARENADLKAQVEAKNAELQAERAEKERLKTELTGANQELGRLRQIEQAVLSMQSLVGRG